MLPDFELIAGGKYRELLEKEGIGSFSKLCAFVQELPYGRNSNRDDLSLVFSEHKGTCSSKHGLLMALCELNRVDSVELMVGIFLMNGDYHPKIKPILEKYDLEQLPEAHCFLRYEGKRYDLTSTKSDPAQFEPFLVREQRCDSQQVSDWKPMIHKHYIEGWLKRKNLDFSPEKIWEIREECILALSESRLS